MLVNLIGNLFSSSKDMTIKLWDMNIQHCFHTIVTHRTEVLVIILLKN
jgi:hypothetical protein